MDVDAQVDTPLKSNDLSLPLDISNSFIVPPILTLSIVVKLAISLSTACILSLFVDISLHPLAL